MTDLFESYEGKSIEELKAIFKADPATNYIIPDPKEFVSRHQYDLEFNSIIDQYVTELAFLSTSDPHHYSELSGFIDMLTRQVIEEVGVSNIPDIPNAFILVPSTNNSYPACLALQLALVDPLHISLCLDHHKKGFKGNSHANKGQFTSLLANQVLGFFRHLCVKDDKNKRLDAIGEWIKVNNEVIIVRQAEIQKIVFPSILHTEIFEGLAMKFSESTRSNLMRLLAGEKIESKLEFNGSGNVLVEFFRRATKHLEQKLSHQETAQYIVQNFMYKRGEQYAEFKEAYVYNLLTDVSKVENIRKKHQLLPKLFPK